METTEDTYYYTSPDCLRFIEEMEEYGLEVEHYRGRNFWEGPAVRVEGNSELAELRAECTVHIQHDSLGYGFIVYPVARDKGEATAEEAREAKAKMEAKRGSDALDAFLDSYHLINPPDDETGDKMGRAIDLLFEVSASLRNASRG